MIKINLYKFYRTRLLGISYKPKKLRELEKYDFKLSFNLLIFWNSGEAESCFKGVNMVVCVVFTYKQEKTSHFSSVYF